MRLGAQNYMNGEADPSGRFEHVTLGRLRVVSFKRLAMAIMARTKMAISKESSVTRPGENIHTVGYLSSSQIIVQHD